MSAAELKVKVLLFAQAREQAGRGQETISLAPGARVSDALETLIHLHPRLAALRPHLAVAVNGALAREGDALADGAEIALLPPVSGG
ncbi:MAG: MoaD/ThiS family protein [Candidatus Eisenbacteria bacterium]|nr:MoaD/ThiS family protein [Candidatus Eisenbacteria bacterium]